MPEVSDKLYQVNGASLVAQGLRIHLAMLGTRVQSLVWGLRSHTQHGH